MIEWAISSELVDYQQGVAVMEARAAAIAAKTQNQLVWLVEHPALYTAGTSAKPGDLSPNALYPVYKSGRGGQFTYHGPGQRVVYLMLDLRELGRDVRAFVQSIEHWLIDALDAFNVKGVIRDGRVGVWVDRTLIGGPRHEDKIAAIGLRVKKWISLHGISLNVEPDLHHFDAIVPCGIREQGLGVTSLVDLGLPITLAEVDEVLRQSFQRQFGPVQSVSPPI
ncbi:octanoyltransferase [Candidatus Phycosocius spiralis]|uniref:Octanoyltransferase n=1 Tax=Candidatus Phycosocius spiralis TaxID=2815099 RepID=A0ABQ4PSI5_9PROT|nr:octanoyltransferase [Candidatus Phycosocius spiralis]